MKRNSDTVATPQPSRTPRTDPAGRIGVFGIGLEAYWAQFPGLQARLQGYQQDVETRLGGRHATVISAGLVDTAPAAAAAGQRFAASDLDLIVCYVGTYATSSQVLPVVQRAKVPVLVLNLQPTRALDYATADTGEWLANCSACCVPEISSAFARAGVRFRVVSGTLYDDPKAWGEIEDWRLAAGVARSLHGSRIGFLGHTYPGMLDLYSDFTMIAAQTGVHVEVLEMCDLAQRAEAATPIDIAQRIELARETFTLENCDPGELEWAARVSVALDRLAADFQLDGLTYYYRGLDGNRYERLAAGLILGNSLLTARGIPASGEGDIKTCLAMLLLDRLGAGGSFTELYAMDFNDNFVLMGHDGPGHLAISDRRPVLRGLGLYHGKRGSGLSVEFKMKTGPVTLLGLTQTVSGDLKLLTAQGESIDGPILRIGNTNSRLRFPPGPAEFVNSWCQEGPTHHCALGVGHVQASIAKVAELAGIQVVSVC